MFEEYRKELKVIFNNLGALDPDMVLTTIHEYLGQTLSNWQRAEFKDVEVAITMLYQLAEALPVRFIMFLTLDDGTWLVFYGNSKQKGPSEL